MAEEPPRGSYAIKYVCMYVSRENELSLYVCNPDLGIWENFVCRIRNPGIWNSEYNARNPESH